MAEYGRTLNYADFGVADTACVAGTWNRLGTYTVPAGMKIAVGRRFDGYAAAPTTKETTPADYPGRIRLVASDPNEFRKVVVLEFDTLTTTDMADKAKKKLVPLTLPWVRQDSKLILEFNPHVGDLTFDVSESTLVIDVTEKV